MDQLTDNEKRIIEVIRSLNPFEKVVIEADKQGKPNNFIVIRSTQMILTDSIPIHVKVYKQETNA